MDLVIGYHSLHESLCVGPAESTRAMAREFSLVQTCSTVGELLKVAPTLTEISLPAEVAELTEMEGDLRTRESRKGTTGRLRYE